MQVKNIAPPTVQPKLKQCMGRPIGKLHATAKPAPGGLSVPEMTTGCRLRDGERHVLLQEHAEQSL